jgi:hypothetical protein
MMEYKILIITLYCGEAEYDDCKQSVKNQKFNGLVDHIFIEHKPNIEAHKTCYQTIMDQSDKYNLFIKMDADMVFTHDQAISDILKFWDDQHKPDHMVFAVKDFIPDRLSIGIHAFSNRCTWHLGAHDTLFVDPNPSFPGHSIKKWNAPAPFIDHAPKPSMEGAYHFGMHRALKAFQYDRFFASPQAIEAFRILQSTATHYKKTQNPKIKMALMGAEAIRGHHVKMNTGDKQSINTSDYPINFWMNKNYASIYWWVVTGWRIIPTVLFRKLKKLVCP